MNHYIISLDLGTNNTSIVAALYDETSSYGIKILYQETVPSRGIKRGIIYNQSEVQKVVAGLFKRLDPKIMKGGPQSKRWYVVNVSGCNYRTEQITANYNSDGHLITQIDIMQILKRAEERLYLEPEKETLSRCTPIYYSLGPTTVVLNPEGMPGVSNFEANFIATIADNKAINDVNAILPSKTAKINKVYSSISAKAAVLLKPQEKKSGVLFVDLGGGTTNVAVYCNETLRYETSLPFGCETITNDISVGAEVEYEKASRLKYAIGLLGKERFGNQEVEFNLDGTNTVCHVGHLDFMIRARVEELISYIDAAVVKSRCRKYINSIVLTGGGASLVGISAAFQEHFMLPTNVAQMPITFIEDCSVQLAGALGLAHLFVQDNMKQFSSEEEQNLFTAQNSQSQPPQPNATVAENAKPEPKPEQKTVKKGNFFKNFLDKVQDTFTNVSDGPSI